MKLQEIHPITAALASLLILACSGSGTDETNLATGTSDLSDESEIPGSAEKVVPVPGSDGAGPVGNTAGPVPGPDSTGPLEPGVPPVTHGGPCEIHCLSSCGEPLPPQSAITCAEPTEAEQCVARSAVCERQADGSCGFTSTPASEKCGEIDRCEIVCGSCSEPLPPGLDVDCVTLTEADLCVMKTAVCERQTDQKCAYTPTPASEACPAPVPN